MPERSGPLSRKRLLQAGGGAVISSTMLGKAATAAAAVSTKQADSNSTIGALTAVHGRNGTATTSEGVRYSGKINERRPLQVGDRMLIESQEDGTWALSPLFVDVAGVVESIDRGTVQVSGETYSSDKLSLVRRRVNGEWHDSGAVAETLQTGAPIEGLGIVNLNSGETVLAVVWAL